MEPVPGSTSGHMQLLDMMETEPTRPLVHALVVEHHPLPLWALTTTVSLELTLVHGLILMTHCGMDKIAMDLSVPAVIPQTSRGSARSFLSQLLMT